MKSLTLAQYGQFLTIKTVSFLAISSLVLLSALTPVNAESGRGRNKKLYAVPAPANVTIDGKLEDWDWSGHIESYERSEVKATQSAEFAVMYDEKALYLGGRIRDTTPLLNRHSPLANAERAWMGDCTQFRLNSDRALAFPLSFGNLGDANDGAATGQPLHLMLWYYTDEKEPALQIHRSMAMQPVRPEWGPHGVVPRDHFASKYLPTADGQGYTYEYRIPWETLNAAKSHPVAGDVVSATVQFLWGDGTGLNHIASAYDVMSQPGFPWQTTGQWGKLLFSKTGSIPRQWVDRPTVSQAPTPLNFSYTMPTAGEASVALYDGAGRIVRHIVAQGARPAGPVTEAWDGLDSAGKPLPAGTYKWKGLYHSGIKTKYVMSLGNSGQPGWKTADGTGGWGGDYGPPTTVAAAGETMVIGWMGHEAGWGIIGTDLSGRKKWGVGHKNAAYLATDGTRFFAAAEKDAKEVNVFSVQDGKPLSFGNGRGGLLAPPGGDEARNLPGGLAYGAGKLFVSYAGRGLIGTYDAASGELLSTRALPAPGRLALAGDGSLLALSGGAVWRLATAGEPQVFAGGHLEAPVGIAVDGAGQVYVANNGALQNISVFDAKGKYLRSIGRRGGRPVVGKFDAGGMLQPAGLAVDANGLLWVPEAFGSLKRLSVWNTRTGKLAREFFGGCSYSPFGWVDPVRPHEAFFDNTIWNIDLEKGTWYPKATFYAAQDPNSVNSGNGGFFYPFRVFTAKNGRQYAVSTVYAFGSVVWIREGDRFRPLYFFFRNRPNHVLMDRPPFPFMMDVKQYPAGRPYLWSDANGDQRAEASEIAELPANISLFQTWLDDALNLYGAGQKFVPLSVNKAGVPLYDFKVPRNIVAGSSGTTWIGSSGEPLYSWQDGNWFGRIDSDGKPLWSYNGLQTWRDAINDGITRPGYLTGATCPLGVAGRYTGLVSYFGTVDVVRDDGLYVTQVFEHPAKGNNGPNVFYIEFLAGQMFSPKGSNRTYIVAGDQDVRFTELLGLDKVRDLTGGTYEHTAAMVAEAAQARQAYEATRQRLVPLVLSRGGQPGLPIADAVGKTVDDKRAFTVQAAYDDRNLYFHYNVTSPNPLVNGIADPQIIYKGGNLLDVQIGANDAVDAGRKQLVPGDMRLLVSRREGKTWAVLLRPKVQGFTGTPITLTSPTGKEDFDFIGATDQVELRDYRQSATGFEVKLVVPLEMAGLGGLISGKEVRMDVGYIFGDAKGLNAAVRSYWHNNSFSANVVNDIPNESRLEPAEWGMARVE